MPLTEKRMKWVKWEFQVSNSEFMSSPTPQIFHSDQNHSSRVHGSFETKVIAMYVKWLEE